MTHKAPHRSTVAMWPPWSQTGWGIQAPLEHTLRPVCNPASQAANTHAMLVLHFSHVWSLGGVASALEVGREACGLNALGRKAGVPPGRGGDRHTHQSWSTTAACRLYLFTHTPPAPTCSRDTHRRTYGWASGVTLGMEGGSDHTRSLAEAGQV